MVPSSGRDASEVYVPSSIKTSSSLTATSPSAIRMTFCVEQQGRARLVSCVSHHARKLRGPWSKSLCWSACLQIFIVGLHSIAASIDCHLSLRATTRTRLSTRLCGRLRLYLSEFVPFPSPGIVDLLRQTSHTICLTSTLSSFFLLRSFSSSSQEFMLTPSQQHSGYVAAALEFLYLATSLFCSSSCRTLLRFRDPAPWPCYKIVRVPVRSSMVHRNHANSVIASLFL
jgi:hypothetical protein